MKIAKRTRYVFWRFLNDKGAPMLWSYMHVAKRDGTTLCGRQIIKDAQVGVRYTNHPKRFKSLKPCVRCQGVADAS